MNEASRAFLRAYFGDDLSGVYVCDSNSMNRPRLAATATLDPQAGWYWCPARLSGLNARGQRVAEKAVSVHALVIDDVGRKVHPAEFAWLATPPLTLLETSEGNAQAGYRLGDGVTPAEWTALRARVPWEVDGTDCVHWWRLPGGINQKRGGFVVGSVIWGEGDLGWLPETPFSKAARAPRSGGGPQAAPSVAAVKAVLEALKNPWEGGEGEGLRGWWIEVLHAIKGALLEWPEDAFELALAWSKDEPGFERVWESIEPHSAGWGALEILAKDKAGPDLAAAAFDDDATQPEKERTTIYDFYAHNPTGKFVYMPTGDLWPASNVNSRCGPTGISDAKGKPLPASEVLKRQRSVDQVSWLPGRPKLVKDAVLTKAGIEAEKDNVILNLYRPPAKCSGVAQHALPWRRHLEMLYPEDAEWISKWMAHCIQRPWEKKNHALVLGGPSGAGKDTILAPLILGVGGQNWQEATPTALLGRFNSFLQSVVLRISEVHNLGENMTRRKLYEHLKPILAAPPATLQIDTKGVEVRSILNVVGVVMTTNYRHEGFYLPEEDRRHYMAWTDVTERQVRQDKGPDYYARLHQWMDGDGAGHVVAFLRSIDLKGWDAKAPPPKTRWWHSVVGVSTQDVNDEALEDAIAAMGSPSVFSKDQLMAAAEPGLQTWIDDPKNTRAFPARLDGQGYERILSGGSKGRWYLKDTRNVSLYGKKSLSTSDQVNACEAWVVKKNEEIEKSKKGF